jgi:dimethylhistidine N-methyltransferase
VELGSGSGAKTRHLLRALEKTGEVHYYPIDVSAAALACCARELGDAATVTPIHAGYLEGLGQAAERSRGRPLAVLFLGSTIGNFEPEQAADFLYAVRRALSRGDVLLLGTDLVKPADVLLNAYDDPAGVTAAFNHNVLARINRELEADFNLRRFEHVARYEQAAQRIEMHLRSTIRQSVRIPGARLAIDFHGGETILTECCYKFRPEHVASMARIAGFRLEARWTDAEWPFAESLLVAA